MGEIKKQQKQFVELQAETERLRQVLSEGGTNESLQALNGKLNQLSGNQTFLTNKANELQTEINDIAELNLENQIEDITESLNEVCEEFDAVRIPVDENDLPGADFYDYEEGEILQGYDCYERKINIVNSTNTLTYLPHICFACEQNSSGAIKYTFKYTISNVLCNILFKLFLNNESVFEELILNSDLNTEYTKEVELNPHNFSVVGNLLYATFSKSTSTSVVNVTNCKCEITVPNANILNKIRPASVLYDGENYFIDDATSGTIKMAQTDASTLMRLSDLEFEDSLIEADSCNRTITTEYSGGYYYGDHIIAYSNLNNSVTVKNLNTLDYVARENSYYAELQDYVTNSSTKVRFVVNYFYSVTKELRNALYSYPSNFSTGGTNSITNMDNIAKITVVKHFGDFLAVNNVNAGVYTLINGQNYLFNSMTSSSSASISLGYGTNVTAYFYDFVGTSNYKVEVYLNVFGKIVKKCYQYISSTFTLLSSTEVGYYDWYLKGVNGDYFVIKDNELLFYKNS